MTPAPDGEALARLAARAFAPGRPARAGIAVSGGGDSVALLHLLHRAGWTLEAVTVDHGLRLAAVAEAAAVAAQCAALGIPHAVLRWQGPRATGNLMDQARRARADLIGAWARAHGIGHVALGHTADDQAESFLMNLARGAGLEGLSGMRVAWDDQGIRWHRPLLGVPRDTLRGWLVAQGIGWIDDPTNEDDRFARVRARAALAALRPLGITVEGMGGTIAHLAQAQAALGQVAAQAAASHVRAAAGALWIDAGALAGLTAEVRRRVLVMAVGWIGRAPYPPRAAQIARLEAAIAEGRAATLAGCRFRLGPGVVLACREARAVAGRAPAPGMWDSRWRITGPQAPGLTVGALGAAGLRLCPDWRATGLPAEVLAVTPAVWRGDALVSAPLAGLAGDWRAEPEPDWAMFTLAH